MERGPSDEALEATRPAAGAAALTSSYAFAATNHDPRATTHVVAVPEPGARALLHSPRRSSQQRAGVAEWQTRDSEPRHLAKLPAPALSESSRRDAWRGRLLHSTRCAAVELSGLPEWRNGRRAGLKIPYPQGCEGSTPSSGTMTSAHRELPHQRKDGRRYPRTRGRSGRGARKGPGPDDAGPRALVTDLRRTTCGGCGLPSTSRR